VDDIHAIQIELRRDLYMNETTYDLVEPGFSKLSETLTDLLRDLRNFRPADLSKSPSPRPAGRGVG
jgi:N-formylglutamate amidohydrolase